MLKIKLTPLRQLFNGLAVMIILIAAGCNKGHETDTSINAGPKVEAPQVVAQVVDPLDENSLAEARWSNHIIQFPAGWVPSKAPLNIQFSHKISTSTESKPDWKKAIRIEPEVEVNAAIQDENVLSILPATGLQAGKIYSFSIDAQYFEGIPNSLPPFKFQVQVLRQSYELKVVGLLPQVKSKTMKLKGSVKTRDRAVTEAIEKSLQVSLEQKSLEIQWVHNDQERVYEFIVPNIPRQKNPTQLTLQYSAIGLGVDKKGSYEIEVPSVNQFSVTGVRVAQNPKQQVTVNFSEPIDRNQNLNGLVRLNSNVVSVSVDGSQLILYPSTKLSGPVKLTIEETIRSSMQLSLEKAYEDEVTFVSELPGVRYVDGGTILPPNDQLTVPIEAINVNSVWVTAFKVYQNNMSQFIQQHRLQSNYVDTRVGRYLWRKKISLPDIPFDEWQRFELDVTDLMDEHREGLVNLQVHIDRTTVAYPCAEDSKEASKAKLKNYEGPGVDDVVERPTWFDQYYSTRNGYITYEKGRNPCNEEYYRYYQNKNISVSKYFMVSDIGLLVKKGVDHKLHVVTTSLSSSEPLENVQLSLFNYQHQKIAEAQSSRLGMAVLESKTPGFYLLAKKGRDSSYIRLPKNEALPTNQFNVSGKVSRTGIKGFIFGERDVWRPGDKIFLTFILEDREELLPEGHPVTLDFFDPRGKKRHSLATTDSIGGLYTFQLNTLESDPTGNWRAVVKVGGDYFDKIIKVETIVPNRLKIELEPAFTPMRVDQFPMRTEVHAQWLNGARANNLRATSELKLSATKTTFSGWEHYHFDDPASEFKSSSKVVFDHSLDASGRGEFSLNMPSLRGAPGKLRATFVNRVFEKSGNFSTTIKHEELFPYTSWVGLNVPKGSGYANAISRDQDHPIHLVSLNSDGKPEQSKTLSIRVYSLGWRWWWDQSKENLANYVRSKSAALIVDESVVTDAQGKATWTLEKNRYDWGRHLIRVCDEEIGHCTGKEVYLGWSWTEQVNPESATQLMLSTDKDEYQPGDVAKIKLPKRTQGKILYSIENGHKVLQQNWLDVDVDQEILEIPIVDEMAPNVFVSVVLLLPHKNKTSDAPIRMYGIIPLLVDNPHSHLQPVLKLPDQVRPQSTFEVEVSEQNQRQMNYTLAIVDEGLLGITGYTAPDPYNAFYRREALGVTTWDLFDGVVGAYGANLERLLKIGGGDKSRDQQSGKERRFPPVVKFLGAFKLAPGDSQTHRVTLPQYMGAVRVMVVAAGQRAYGKAEKTVRVTQPLTVLATLPRVLGPSESLHMPVNVFVSDERIREVEIHVDASDEFKLPKSKMLLEFDKTGDQIVLFPLEVNDVLGQGRVTVKVQSGDEVAEQTIHIPIRSAVSPNIQSQVKMLHPGETWTPDLQPHGMIGTNRSSVTVSQFPPINLEHRLHYLIRYPHGCVEQTTSAIFPQIWLDQLVNLGEEQKIEIQQNVDAAVRKLENFQAHTGGFTYWPGQSYVNDWSSVYVTHFLIEAQQKGYAVPSAMLTSAKNYLKEGAKIVEQDKEYSRLVNAYRLYVLALAGVADLASMNRLREALLKKEHHYDDRLARWLLVMAYQKLGLRDVANELLDLRQNNVEIAQYRHYTYGSTLRDRAMLLQSLSASEKNESAWEQATELAKMLSQNKGYSTHSTSWALLALSKYANELKADGSRFSIAEKSPADSNLTWQALSFQSPLYRQSISPAQLKEKNIILRNDGDSIIHITIDNEGTALQSQEAAEQKGILLDVEFFDLKGNSLDVQSLPQGKDFVAEVSVSADQHDSIYAIEDIALTMTMPSGWQIRNQRLEGREVPHGLDFQDIRDDRVLSYFSLWNDYYWYYRYNDHKQNTITFQVTLNASFAGKYYLPAWHVGAMYDDSVRARNEGMWVEVVK